MKKKLLRYILPITMILFLIGCGSEKQNIKDLRQLNTNSTYSIHINELLSANTNTNYDPDFKEFSDWIELYNESNESVDLSGYYLSDSKKNIKKWEFPKNTQIKPYNYLLVWADGKDTKQKALHTNFKLSQKGERVILSNQNGITIDKIKYSAQEGDISCKKINDKTVYMNPTPNAINSQQHQYLIRAKKPIFLQKSGFYNGEQIIELEADGEIYYTLDGSHPTTSSLHYNSPISIDKTTVIRAINIEDGKFASHSFAQTYLIDEDISLPVMSLSIDDKYLQDDEIGIYKNYNEDWERAGNIEFIKNGESKFSQNVGVKLHGSKSKTFPIKSFAIVAKNKYEKKFINYHLFQDKPQIENIKSFLLRNSGNDWRDTLIRDALTHSLAKEIGKIDYLSYEPIITFVNGNYYGILNLREKADSHYIESNHGISSDNIDMITTKKGDNIILKGDNISYSQLIDFIQTNTLSNEDNYNFIKDQINIESFINYFSLQLYISNIDWLHNNTKYWKDRTNTSKWEWLLYDTDYGFGLKSGYNKSDVTYNTLEDFLPTESSTTGKIYNALIENYNFKKSFTKKYYKLLNTTFQPQNINKKIKELSNKISPEIPRHLKRWFGDTRSFEDWEDDIQKLYDYSNQRNEIVREQLEEFELSN